MNAEQILQKINRLEESIARDETRYDNAINDGDRELASKLTDGTNESKATLKELYAELRELGQEQRQQSARSKYFM